MTMNGFNLQWKSLPLPHQHFILTCLSIHTVPAAIVARNFLAGSKITMPQQKDLQSLTILIPVWSTTAPLCSDWSTLISVTATNPCCWFIHPQTWTWRRFSKWDSCSPVIRPASHQTVIRCHTFSKSVTPPPPRACNINPCLNLCDADAWNICAPQIFITYISILWSSPHQRMWSVKALFSNCPCLRVERPEHEPSLWVLSQLLASIEHLKIRVWQRQSQKHKGRPPSQGALSTFLHSLPPRRLFLSSIWPTFLCCFTQI